MKRIKIISIYILVLIIEVSCGSTTYMNALHHNKDKFLGQKEEDALFLVELKEQSLMSEAMAKKAMDHAYAKDIYLNARMIAENQDTFQKKLDFFAMTKSIKMPTSLKDTSVQINDSLKNINSRLLYDEQYAHHAMDCLNRMVWDMEKYATRGNNERIRSFLAKHVKDIKENRENLRDIQKELIYQQDSNISTRFKVK